MSLLPVNVFRIVLLRYMIRASYLYVTLKDLHQFEIRCGMWCLGCHLPKRNKDVVKGKQHLVKSVQLDCTPSLAYHGSVSSLVMGDIGRFRISLHDASPRIERCYNCCRP
jgi:hypothetical protein